MNFLELARRFVVISAFGLWLGGFTVYTAFVIRLGHRRFPDRQFGFLTGEVTSVLGVLAAVAAAVACINLAIEWKRLSGGLKWTTVAAVGVLLITLGASFMIHSKLDGLLDYKAQKIADQSVFQPWHERYELAASLQWAAGLFYLGCQLTGWRRADGDRRTAQ
jgi:hypothetical protein